MLLTSENIAHLRQAMEDGHLDRILDLALDGISLAGLTELCCAFRIWGAQGAVGSSEVFQHLAARLKPLAPVCALFRRAYLHPDQPAGPALFNDELMVQVFGDADGIAGDEGPWLRFQEVFLSRMRTAGLPTNWPYAVLGALVEMVDNVREHSAPGGQRMVPALVGCQVTAGQVHFAVADLGRGVLNSLWGSPHWRGLSSDTRALAAIVHDRATSKPEHPQGDGFDQLFKSFLDRNGTMRLQSGHGVADAFTTQKGERAAQIGTCAFLPGLRLSAAWSARGATDENKLSDLSLTH